MKYNDMKTATQFDTILLWPSSLNDQILGYSESLCVFLTIYMSPVIIHMNGLDYKL